MRIITTGLIIQVVVVLLVLVSAVNGRLTVCEKNTEFICYNEQPIFLVGANQAWQNYALGDFGDKHYFITSMTQLQAYITQIKLAGGNSIRMWVHIEGQSSPMFSPTGHVISTDKQLSLIPELMEYLLYAHVNNVFVFLCLWNGAFVTPGINERLHGLITDETKLQSYIDMALIPMVTALMNEPALGGWDIMNEPEGVMTRNVTSESSCWDNTFLEKKSSGRGIGWAGQLYTPRQLQRFINLQASAIRKVYKTINVEPLITVGSWNPISNTFAWNCKNLYSDYCLQLSGNKTDGYLSFWSTHTYDDKTTGEYDVWSPFNHNYSDYALGGFNIPPRPLVIAEFNQIRGRPHTKWDIKKQFQYLYGHGYAGAWSWHARAEGVDTDDWPTQMAGISSLRGKYGIDHPIIELLPVPLGSLYLAVMGVAAPAITAAGAVAGGTGTLVSGSTSGSIGVGSGPGSSSVVLNPIGKRSFDNL